MQKIRERFTLRSKSGAAHQAEMWCDQIEMTTLADTKRQFVDGVKDYRLADGRHLNYIDENTFELVDTGERLTRV